MEKIIEELNNRINFHQNWVDRITDNNRKHVAEMNELQDKLNKMNRIRERQIVDTKHHQGMIEGLQDALKDIAEFS